jgi:hypothetical protein
MPQPTKPGLDWTAIEARFRSGSTSSALAREFDVSRQAIDKRAKREGWVAEQRRSRLRDATVAVIAKERHPSDRFGLRCPENMARALELAEQGATQVLIAAGIGMTPSAFNHWLDDDPDFRAAVHEAWSRHAMARLGNVNGAADRGDARAAQWAVERNPIARDDFANPGRTGDSGSITVILNVPRSMERLDAMEEGRTIDHAPILLE